MMESQKTPDFNLNFGEEIWIACVQSKIALKLSPATIKCGTWLESFRSQLRPSAAHFYQYVHSEVWTIENQKIKFEEKKVV